MNETVIKLWEGDTPGYIEGEEIPALTYYPTDGKRGRGTVIICPGGAYRLRAPHEGVDYARYLNSIGLDAFVLDYRVKPYTFPYPLLDARRAIRYVRANAERYGIDPEKIAIMGSSAGGHLAAISSTYKGEISGEGVDSLDEVDCMPNAQILCYPVLDLEGHPGSFINLLADKYAMHKRVTPSKLADESTPPLFLWHTATDGAVDVNGSFRYASRLHELGVSIEIHVYPDGPHGMGLANNPSKTVLPYVQNWAVHLKDWLIIKGYIGE